MSDNIISRLNRIARITTDSGIKNDMACAVAQIQNGQSAIDTNERLTAELGKHRWVPVEERLPEQSGAYLVILYTVPDVARLYYYYAPNEEFGQTRSGVWCAETVTHWMPLPEPPEEVTP